MMDIQPAELLERIGAGDAPMILDVRSAAEFASGHLPGAINIPFYAVPFRAGELDPRHDDLVVVYCGHGPRAHLASAALRARGFTRVACLAGHMAEWLRAGHPMEK
jgi:rhodanese-related sulfurtransferase